MKNIKFLLGFLSVVIVMTSCVTTQGSMSDDMDDLRTQQIGNRIYMQDPFYGPVVLERDPYTGRYYDVTFGSRLGGMGYGYPGRYNRGGVYNRGSFGRGSGGVIRQQQPSREQVQPNRDETRKKILGN